MKKSFLTTIGLEIHIQLDTASKMFCRCSNEAAGKLPNSVACPICAGMPGTLPVPNSQAVEWSIKTALALDCKINMITKFDRKNYFYPDLPKGYQISQLDLPISEKGKLEIVSIGEDKKIQKGFVGINRLHLEEDAGKLTHPKGENYSLVDFNRTGTPLMEIVTEPEIHTPEEAKIFLENLRLLSRYLGVSRADMEKGHLRCDANISLAPHNSRTLGQKVEIKNLNSFRSVQKALEYEEKRQFDLLNKGKKIIQETRGWDDVELQTMSQRTKEEAPDYRYFPEPDIPEIKIPDKKIKKIKKSIADLPNEILIEMIERHKLDYKTAVALLNNKYDTIHFRKVIEIGGDPKKIARLIIQKYTEFKRQYKFVDIEQFGIMPEYTFFASTILEKYNSQIENTILVDMFAKKRHPEYIIRDKNIKNISGNIELTQIVNEVIRQNQQAVKDYKSGQKKSIGFLIGQVMMETKGQANPQKVTKIIEEQIKKN
ncbi:Asp-tRNA(Asn)/Glu-tRNA(Gln) amidotransferase subunit GatB [Patescibacteria group bacterium]